MTDKIYEKKKPIPIKIKQNNIKIYSWGFSKNGQTGIENCQYTPEPHNIKFQSPNNEIIKIISGENNSSFITKDYSTYIIFLLCLTSIYIFIKFFNLIYNKK